MALREFGGLKAVTGTGELARGAPAQVGAPAVGPNRSKVMVPVGAGAGGTVMPAGGRGVAASGDVPLTGVGGGAVVVMVGCTGATVKVSAGSPQAVGPAAR